MPKRPPTTPINNAEITYCSPARHEEGLRTRSCFKKSELVQIAKDINVKYQKNIKIGNKPKEILHREIMETFKNECGDKEYCWVDKALVKRASTLAKQAFRPPKPKEWNVNPRQWLNTYDILYVLKQYEERITNFMFTGVYPIDFQERYTDGTCIGESLCTFDIHKDVLEKGKRRFAIVLNLDKHYQSGSHWVSIYCDLRVSSPNYGIFYYDSTAHPAPPEVKRFMTQVQEQVRQSPSYSASSSKKFVVKENVHQKQYKNTECGMFSIVFISQCLKEIPFDEICKRMHKDDGIHAIRSVIYRPRNT